MPNVPHKGERLLRIVVLISGSGSNLQAILDAVAEGDLHAQIAAVISNRPGARGLARAQAAGVTAITIDHRAYASREAFDQALAEQIDAQQPDLVVLAGFMRILTPAFVDHYLGRMLNIHPSLLPAFRGLQTHARALEAGVSTHGASVHFVTSELDGGPVIAQAEVPVRADDTPQSLAARVLAREHQLYPRVIEWFAQGRLKLLQGRAVLDGEPLLAPYRISADAGQVHAWD